MNNHLHRGKKNSYSIHKISCKQKAKQKLRYIYAPYYILYTTCSILNAPYSCSTLRAPRYVLHSSTMTIRIKRYFVHTWPPAIPDAIRGPQHCFAHTWPPVIPPAIRGLQHESFVSFSYRSLGSTASLILSSLLFHMLYRARSTDLPPSSLMEGLGGIASPIRGPPCHFTCYESFDSRNRLYRPYTGRKEVLS